MKGVKGVARGTGDITDDTEPVRCGEKKCFSASAQGAKGTICCCNTDLCNGAMRTYETTLIILPIVSLLLISRY